MNLILILESQVIPHRFQGVSDCLCIAFQYMTAFHFCPCWQTVSQRFQNISLVLFEKSSAKNCLIVSCSLIVLFLTTWMHASSFCKYLKIKITSKVFQILLAKCLLESGILGSPPTGLFSYSSVDLWVFLIVKNSTAPSMCVERHLKSLTCLRVSEWSNYQLCLCVIGL